LVSLVSLCALVGALVLAAAPAQAARGHVLSLSFGEEGSAAGKLSGPRGVAVNESSGDIYVVDKGNDRVEYFNSTGAYVGEFNGSGENLAEGKAAPTGRFSEPEAIAIDNEAGSPSEGDVYVADSGHNVIDKFSASGKYIGQIKETSSGSSLEKLRGLAIDDRGKLWVCQEAGEIDAFSNAVENEFLSRINLAGHRPHPYEEGQGCPFAVDTNDDIYVHNRPISKLNSSGEELILEFDSLTSEFFISVQVAVDLANNEVYISNADGEDSIGRFTATGTFVEKFGSAELTGFEPRIQPLAVDAQTGEVYAADKEADRVYAFALEGEGRPTILSDAPSVVTTTSATLEAQIKPTGPETTYYFQYGTAECSATPAACSELPAPPGASIGGGFEEPTVSVHLQGLQPATAYHFRVVASNALGTSDGVEQTFVTQTAGGEFALPDDRLWEMVTPPEKHGASLIPVGNEQGADIQAAKNGDAITFAATAPLATNPAGSRALEVTQGFSTRTGPGVWSTQDITTAHDEGSVEGLAVGSANEYKLFSSNLSLGLVEPTGDTPLPPLPAGAEKTMYLRTDGGEYMPLLTTADVLLGTKFGGSGDIEGGAAFVNGTPDLSHVVLDSQLQLTTTPIGKAGSYLYEWAGGHLQLASILPDGEPVPASLGDRGERDNGNTRQAISSDGSRIVFEANNGHDYLRDMPSGHTVQVDAAQGTPEPPAGVSAYRTASSTDSRVFFTSYERLTGDSTTRFEVEPYTTDLYEFELTSGPGQPPAGKLNDLTVDANAGESADVLGVIGASEEGSYVYFVANGVLGDAAANGAKPGDCERTFNDLTQTCSLYVDHYNTAINAWEQPHYIATLSGADAPSWGEHHLDLDGLTARVSPNGRYLAFMSERSLTDYENRDFVSGVPDEEVYLYDADSGRLVCASCNPTGARPSGILVGEKFNERLVDATRGLWENRWLASNIPGWTTKDLSSAVYQSRYLSNSGRLFFNSADALVPADVNGREDVYEYEPAGLGSCQAPGYGQSASDVFDERAGGCIGLISAGTSPEESAFMDASEGGGDVFFMTLSRLSPQDFDTSLDIYDAHECTALAPCAPPAAATPPPCSTGDACKPAPAPQPSIFGAPSSETFSGAGNISPPPAAVVKPKTKTAKCPDGKKRNEHNQCVKGKTKKKKTKAKKSAHANRRAS
jgi:DNA-binding beta-propeller fold protein YncE